MGRAKFPRYPIAYRATEYTQYRGDQERSNRRHQQNEAAPLAMQKARLFGVAVNYVDAFHDQYHHLRTGQQSSAPADDSPLPCLRRPLDQELGNDLAAAGRQITREIRNHVEQ